MGEYHVLIRCIPLKGGVVSFGDVALSGQWSDWMLLFLNINYCWLPWTATIRFRCRGVRAFLRIERLASTRALDAQMAPFVVVPPFRLTSVRRLRGLACVPLSLLYRLHDSENHHRNSYYKRSWHAKRPIHPSRFSGFLHSVQYVCACLCWLFVVFLLVSSTVVRLPL